MGCANIASEKPRKSNFRKSYTWESAFKTCGGTEDQKRSSSCRAVFKPHHSKVRQLCWFSIASAPPLYTPSPTRAEFHHRPRDSLRQTACLESASNHRARDSHQAAAHPSASARIVVAVHSVIHQIERWRDDEREAVRAGFPECIARRGVSPAYRPYSGNVPTVVTLPSRPSLRTRGR